MLISKWKKKARFKLSYFLLVVGRKRFRKFEKVCGSFLELKEVVMRRTLRFWSGFMEELFEMLGWSIKDWVLNHQRSIPFEPKQQDSIPFSTRIKSLGSKSWKQLDLPTKTSSAPLTLCIIVFSFYVSSSMYIFIMILCNNMINFYWFE